MVTKRDIIDLRRRMFEGYGKGNEGNARIDFNIYLGNYLPEAEMWDPLPKDHEFDREIRENLLQTLQFQSFRDKLH